MNNYEKVRNSLKGKGIKSELEEAKAKKMQKK
jgi:hypothetical protein